MNSAAGSGAVTPPAGSGSSRTNWEGGTLSYMAPEVFDGEPTKEADVWSFGVM